MVKVFVINRLIISLLFLSCHQSKSWIYCYHENLNDYCLNQVLWVSVILETQDIGNKLNVIRRSKEVENFFRTCCVRLNYFPCSVYKVVPTLTRMEECEVNHSTRAILIWLVDGFKNVNLKWKDDLLKNGCRKKNKITYPIVFVVYEDFPFQYFKS